MSLPKTAWKKIIISLLVLGLFLPLDKKTLAQQTSMKSLLKEIAEKISEIADLKKDRTLSDEERAAKELNTRKEALTKIFDLTLLEDADLKSKLNGIENLNEDQEKIKNRLLEFLAENENAYSEMKKRMEEAQTVNAVKQLASDFKNWRGAVYNPKVEKIISFTLVFQQKRTLDLVYGRLNKIKTELEKLVTSGLIVKSDTEKLMQKSLSNLSQAENSSAKAETVLLIALAKELFPPKSKLFSKPSITPEISLNDENGKDPTVKSLVEESFLYTKLAYKYLVEIGKIVKEKMSPK